MRVVIVLAMCVGALSVAVVGWAGPPMEGTYKSSDGDMFDGRASESWPGGSDFEIGDALHLQSWDGSTLGTEWYIRCPAICAAPVLLVDTVNGSGNGFQIWQSDYCGGTLWLNADGGEPWSDGSEVAYWADIDALTQITTIQFVAFNPVGWVTDLNMRGVFDDFGDMCMNLFLANLERVGDTASATFPADYPDLVEGAGCTLTDVGSAWDVDDITMSILGPCATPTEAVSWGEVKSTYR